ncbi:MAG: uroporphyrinogen decarboxylase family protein [Promethearchaeota archaeon]
MNAEERVLTTIAHEEPDRVPAFESAFTNNTIMKHYGMAVGPTVSYPKVPDETLKKITENKTIIKGIYKKFYEFYGKVGIDIGLSFISGFIRTVCDNGQRINEDGKLFHTEIYEKDGTAISGYIGGYLKSFEDYESWEPPDPHWEARLNHFLMGKEVQKEMNNDVFSVPAVGAMFEVTWERFGLETFSRILGHPKQIKKIFDDRGKFVIEVVKMLAENDAKLILLWDDYGFKNGLFMSPKNFRRYVFPWIKKICDTAHKHDCKILLHSDGDLMEIFGDIIEAGVDALNPIEPTTANTEYDIFKLNEKYGDKITFVGNLSPVMLATGEISEIKGYAKRLIREIAPGGGYIFSSGHSINPAVTVDRFEAMQNIKRKYGTYPIKVPE